LTTVAEEPKVREKIMARTPLGRVGEPDEIAAIAAFLASEDAAYITGQCIYAEGGRLALNLVVDRRDRSDAL
jgi:NAD(P)-dependent dehydrogenase (short-subunit alcohol dehydrogenase family)